MKYEILIILGSISFVYCNLILYLTYYFNKFVKKSNLYKPEYSSNQNIFVSVIIPCRNESENIENILNNLFNQSYNKSLLEIIVVDDDSEDDTYLKAVNFSEKHSDLNIKLIKINHDSSKPLFKKFAIDTAIQTANGELIFTTDADCKIHHDWVKSIVDFYKLNYPKMIVGMVTYMNDNNFFMKIQHLEFLSLIATGIGAIEGGYPIMCNGANLIYQKQAYIEVNGFDGNNKYVSGDDIFLMLKFKKHYGIKSIQNCNNKSSVVYTKAENSLKGFVNQRIRWGSKTKGYKDINIFVTGGIIFLYSVVTFCFLLYSIINIQFVKYYLILTFIKCVIDFPILYQITAFVNRKDLLKNFLFVEILYIPYFVIISIFSLFKSYNWKGRMVRNTF